MSGGERIAAGGQIASVQVLRALAALMVVLGHAQHDAVVTAGRTGLAFARNHLLPWGAGVDLFFVISGFIMVHASARLFGAPGAAREFMRRRLIRIVPLYWLLASAYLVLAHGIGGAVERPSPDLAGLAASYLFWPYDLFRDGVPRPFYDLGWTLNYEMFFYLLFAAFIALPRNRAVASVSLVLAAGVAIASLATPDFTAMAFWTRPIVLEFVLGMGIALAANGGLRLPRAAAMMALGAALAILVFDPMGAAGKPATWIAPNGWLRLAGWGLPAGLAVAALVLVARNKAALPGPLARFWIALGDASYALYLVHPFVIVAGRKLWLALGLHQFLGLWPMVGAMVAGSIAAAFLLHHGVEKPMTSWLQRKTA